MSPLNRNRVEGPTPPLWRGLELSDEKRAKSQGLCAQGLVSLAGNWCQHCLQGAFNWLHGVLT